MRDPDILIFDEATSHLDTATERAIQSSLRAELAGKTVILVAHRLSTVKDADMIYILNHGHIVESGTHDELLAQRQQYWGLWQAQTGATELCCTPRLPKPSKNGHKDYALTR